MINNVWHYTDYTYTASGTPAPAVLNAPSPGSNLTASTVQFGWTAGTGVDSYMFAFGSNGVGGSNLYSSGRITATTATVTNIPINGLPLYARLYSMINNVWHYTDYTYATGSTVKGQIFLGNTCGPVARLPTFKVSIDTSPAKQTTTDPGGNFTFSNIPNGAYTITPSSSAPESVFFPIATPVNVSGGNVSGLNFSAQVGYNVSGTVNYSSPTQSGKIYVSLNNSSCYGDALGTQYRCTWAVHNPRGAARHLHAELHS
jgi:hypothetical protein